MHPKDPIIIQPGVRTNTFVYHINNGFYYSKHCRQGSRIYLRCIERHTCDCRASFPVSKDERTVDNFRLLSKHSHEPDFNLSLMKVLKLREAILIRCREELTDFKTIFYEECARFPKEISSQLSFNRCMATMYKNRRALKQRIDGGKPLKRKMSPDPYKTKKARTQSNLPEDVATYRTHCPTSDSGLQRNQDIEEGFKEELILEDYGNSGGALEDTLVESESNENSLDKSNMVAQECPSTFEDAPVPFESVNCSGVIQVKQEIIDDEADDVETLHESESSSTSHVTVSVSEPSCRSYLGNTEKTPPPLSGDQNMSATVNKSIDAGALGYTIPTGVGLTTVVPSQPLMIAATTANYFGVIMTESLPAVTNYNVATTANYNVAATANYNVATTANYNVTNTANYNVAAAPTPTCFTSLSSISTSTPAVSSNEASVVTDPPTSATNAPGQPPRDEPSPHTSDQEDSEGVFISLKKVPMKRRKKTKQKLLRLVKLITELDLDPDEVCFSVTTK